MPSSRVTAGTRHLDATEIGEITMVSTFKGYRGFPRSEVRAGQAVRGATACAL